MMVKAEVKKKKLKTLSTYLQAAVERSSSQTILPTRAQSTTIPLPTLIDLTNTSLNQQMEKESYLRNQVCPPSGKRESTAPLKTQLAISLLHTTPQTSPSQSVLLLRTLLTCSHTLNLSLHSPMFIWRPNFPSLTCPWMKMTTDLSQCSSTTLHLSREIQPMCHLSRRSSRLRLKRTHPSLLQMPSENGSKRLLMTQAPLPKENQFESISLNQKSARKRSLQAEGPKNKSSLKEKRWWSRRLKSQQQQASRKKLLAPQQRLQSLRMTRCCLAWQRERRQR